VLFLWLAGGCSLGQRLIGREDAPEVTRDNTYGRADFRDVPVDAQAIDFALRDIRGKVRTLSSLYADSIVVVQFASASCPYYVNNLREMGALVQDYRRPEVLFLTVYTAEANPGYLSVDEQPHTWEDRRKLAARFRYEYSYLEHGKRRHAAGTKVANYPNRITLVDSLPDVVASIYGYHPEHADNPCVIIDRGGVIAAKARRTTAAFVRETLDRLLAR